MKYTHWQKPDPRKYYFTLPNEIFPLGLEAGAIAVYSYLLRCEDRKTHQCWPSYKTIGIAVNLSKNTVITATACKPQIVPSRLRLRWLLPCRQQCKTARRTSAGCSSSWRLRWTL